MLRSQSSTLEDIYRHYDRVAEFDQFEIPDAVQDRYEMRLAEIEKQQKMKKMATIGGIAVGVIVLLGVVYSLVF